jgi:hypothetical protein
MMTLKDRLSAMRVEDEAGRAQALEVLRATYRDEKGWVSDEEKQVPEGDLARPDISWFVVQEAGAPVGVLRVLYDPPLHLYKEYGLDLLDRGADIEAFIRSHRIAEIGRFAVLPDKRRHTVVVLALIRAAITETVGRGYTHYITDVFEDDPHSPYEFHTRVLGFVPVATHEVGELNCTSRRITLVLDLRQCYRRMSAANGFFFRFITDGWSPELHRALAP